MYQIKNGFLEKDGKRVFALGQSYYPSFHKAKYPVPPEGDRMAEMKKDLKLMAEMGFNHVRFAGLGEMKLENEQVVTSTPFVDAMVEEADKVGISTSIRLQGYVINLHGYENVLMIDSEGNEQDTSRWFDFIQTTLHHPGMLEDNAMATQALAKHFAQFPGVVAYQIYNEPHYPMGVFDYHPMAIEAYRKYLVETGVMTQEEAANYEPPRHRKESTPEMWARWRCFTTDALTRFLSDSSQASKEAVDLPTYTCLTTCQAGTGNSFRGCDINGCARGMDIIGYTSYYSAQGADYYAMSMLMDMNACAAMLEDKTCWCIELDSRTKIPPYIFNQNTYTCVGSGVKGIVYYQWRGDYPSEATPIPNGCGLVNYDGSKTANYENAGAMVQLLNTLSDYLVGARRTDCGIGILNSNYSSFYADALENDNETIKFSRNSNISLMTQIYTDLRKQGLTVTMTDARGIRENMDKFKILFVPRRSYLSPEEDALMQAFVANGGTVYELAARNSPSAGLGLMGYEHYGVQQQLYRQFMQIEDICYIHDLKPQARSVSPFVPMQILEGDGYKLLCLTNISIPHRPVSTEIQLNFEGKKATLYTNLEAPVQVPICDGKINLENIADGGILVVEE